MAGNSWQQPVAGEPSAGTPHNAPLNGTNLRQIYTGTPATTPNTTEVDVSSYVPVGTRAIYIVGGIKTSSNTLDYLRASKTSTANYDNAIWPVQGYGAAANQYFPISGIIYLDSNRKFWLWRSSGGVALVDIWINAYFI